MAPEVTVKAKTQVSCKQNPNLQMFKKSLRMKSKRCGLLLLIKILLLYYLSLSAPAPVRGFWIVSDLSLGATMICITSTYECLLLPLLYVTSTLWLFPYLLGQGFPNRGL